MAKKPKKRGRGRPNTRGETVQVGFRAVERYRQGSRTTPSSGAGVPVEDPSTREGHPCGAPRQ